MSLAEINTRIAKAAALHGRDPGDITLIAVSKVQPLERVEAVAGRRSPRLRREPRAGSAGQMARVS